MSVADPRVRLPTFLILGAPKCGTTALAAAVETHPDVQLSRPKEPHFFDCHFAKGLDAYVRAHYTNRRAGRVAGEATPSYLALPWVANRIAGTIPDVRLVAILRDPVERAFSSWWMFHARGMDRLSFEDAISENERRLAERPLGDDEASKNAWSLHVDALARGDEIQIRTYLDSGYYARQLRRYFEAFPREQTLVLFSDELRRDGETTLRRVWRHIGVPDDAPFPAVDQINEAVDQGAARVLGVAQKAGLMRFRHLLPARVRAAVKRRLSARGDRPSMSEQARARLVAHFVPHVGELEALLAVDLSEWKRKPS